MFERVNYPDGQISAKYKMDLKENIIKMRINSYEDLFFLRSCADIIQNGETREENWQLYIPCLFGQRSDRRFEETQSFDLKLIAEIINACEFKKVTILDPHSDVSMALINNSKKMTSFRYVRDAYQDILERQMMEDGFQTDRLLVAPDAGAYKKVYEYGEALKCPVMGAMKHHSKDGEIKLLFTHDVEGKDCFIVDDLCDGGYTFLLLAKALRENKARKVYLYVSHGLFSKGFGELAKVIDHIYCTNSVKDIGDKLVVGNGVELKVIKDYVTQYKVI